MKGRSLHRSGRAAIPVVIVACVVLAAVVVMLVRRRSNDDSDKAVLLQTVERGDFEAFVTEPGDVASSSNVEIKCEVRARGGAGTAILKICEEGVTVQPGDFLVQFDDSVLQQELLAQEIAVANDKAMKIQTTNNLDNAERTLREYTEGLFEQERDVLDAQLFVAQENANRAVTYLEYSRRLAAKGYVTANQLQADEFAAEKAKKDLAIAERKLNVYNKFTQDKMVGQYEAEIKKLEARVEAATHTLELSEKKRDETKTQIGNCLVEADAVGQVVYANDREGRGGPQVIEEGTLIREHQIIIRLPDLRDMQVDVKINESHVNRIRVGQPARIILDAYPEITLHGKVKEVAPYPFPMRWHGSPMEYGAVVAIDNPPPTIRPGLRAKVKIIFESQPNVLQVPLAAVIEQGDCHYCLVREQSAWHAKPVKIGSNNNNQVIVLEGLSEGDQVSMTPFQHIERSDLPDGVTSELAHDKQRKKHSNKPVISSAAVKPAPAS